MVQIVLNDEQLEIVRRSGEPGELVDRAGQRVGRFTPANLDATDPHVALALDRMAVAGELGISAKDWDEIERRKREPGEYVTYQQIRERLSKLEAQ